MAKYRQLSAEERVKIETLAGKGHSGKSIARILGRSQSTISSELRRSRKGEQPNGAARSQALAAGRRKAAAQAGRGGLGALRGAAEGGLEPGADRGPGEAGGRSRVERDVALQVAARGARRRRRAVLALAAARQAAQGQSGGRRSRSGADSGTHGHRPAAAGGGREVVVFHADPL